MSAQTSISQPSELRAVYREPGQAARDKVIDHLDDGAAAFIGASPLFVLSTATATGADASPRGGPPGFVRTIDRQHLAWGDLVGNNRLDSFSNLLEQPHIGMLFFVPGTWETMRVNGTAHLVQNPEILELCAIDGRRPKTAVVVTVAECYIHCGAALRRSQVWDTSTWPEADEAPSAAAILKAHVGTERSAEEIEAGLEYYYDHHIWEPGGRTDESP